MNGSNLNNVPLNFGRYIAVAEYLLFARTDQLNGSGQMFVPTALRQPRLFFVDTIKKIHGYKRHKRPDFYTNAQEETRAYKDVDDILASIIDSFPSEGIPAHFNHSDQTIIMLNYNKQKDELYAIAKEENNG